MEKKYQDTKVRTSAEFVESSVLEAVVPRASSINIEDSLSSWDGSGGEDTTSILPFLQQRSYLFFDETVPVYIVLRTPQTDRKTLRSYLSRLEVTLEGYAISTTKDYPDGKGESASGTKEPLVSQVIEDNIEPIDILIKSGADEQDHDRGEFVYVIWKIDVSLGHPKSRVQKPAVYFRPSASLRPVRRVQKKVTEDEYLPSLAPIPVNLFQGLDQDPVFAKRPPRLSALRVSKITPKTSVEKDLLRPIRAGTRRLFRIAPALIWRIRYSKWQSSSNDISIIASLDIEAASVPKNIVRLDNLHLELSGGQVEPYSSSNQPYPLLCKPGDQTTLIFKLKPDIGMVAPARNSTLSHNLDLHMKVTALVSDECTPRMSIAWKTTVDFAVDTTPGQGKMGFHREQPLSQGNTQAVQSATQSSSNIKHPGPDSLPAPEEHLIQQQTHGTPLVEVTLTISGPGRLHVGEVFRWTVFIINKSDRARRLALVAIPRRRRGEMRRHENRPSVSSIEKSDQEDLPEAVVDENIIHAKQRNAQLEHADLICLSTDVRVGPLAPGACYTTEIEFLPVSTGVLSIEALRVIDAGTNEFADVRDLPSILVLEKNDN